ncbi:hypothetical protein MMC18_007198 [Xylographa bjoerkii]|nr:hypothetical protein [Xylographa bjoerkii]
MSSSERKASVELSVIDEAAVMDRRLSGTPEPIDPKCSEPTPEHISFSPPNAPHNRAKTEDYVRSKKTLIESFSPSAQTHEHSRGLWGEFTPSSTASALELGASNTDTHDFFDKEGRTMPAEKEGIPNTSQPSSKKNTAAGSVNFQTGSRQSTGFSNVSASFEDTEAWDRKAVLTLDGGGIRGYSSLLVLRELMRKIEKLEREHCMGSAETSFHPLSPASSTASDSSNENEASTILEKIKPKALFLPCHYFDYIAGTSTGGLIGIMLGRLRMNIDDCITDYESLGNEVFGHSRWVHLRSPLFWPRDKYNHKTLEKVIHGVVNRRVPRVASFPGGRNFAYDEKRCRTIVVSYQKRTEEGIEKPYLFRTYKNLHKSLPNSPESALDRNPDLAHDIPIWDVGRATSAAPSYFEPAVIDGLEYVDGGFGANNPSREAYREVRRMNNNSARAIGILVSIGTGLNQSSSRFKDRTGLSKYLNFVDGLSRYLNYVNFMKKWATDAEHTHQDMLYDSRNIFEYCRLNVVEGIGTMKLDEWKTRGKLRRGLGVLIGKMRPRIPKVDTSVQQTQSGETELEIDVNKANASRGDDVLNIPEWFKARNKTIEFMTKCTNETT